MKYDINATKPNRFMRFFFKPTVSVDQFCLMMEDSQGIAREFTPTRDELVNLEAAIYKVLK